MDRVDKHVLGLALILLIVIILGACRKVESRTMQVGNVAMIGDFGIDQVDRFIDPEYGVVCYRYTPFYGGGISCVKIEDWQWK